MFRGKVDTKPCGKNGTASNQHNIIIITDGRLPVEIPKSVSNITNTRFNSLFKAGVLHYFRG